METINHLTGFYMKGKTTLNESVLSAGKSDKLSTVPGPVIFRKRE